MSRAGDSIIAHLDTLEHGWVEDVDTSVDSVSDEFNGLLYESVDGAGVGELNDDTVFRWLVNLCDEDRTFTTVVLVEGKEFVEGI